MMIYAINKTLVIGYRYILCFSSTSASKRLQQNKFSGICKNYIKLNVTEVLNVVHANDSVN